MANKVGKQIGVRVEPSQRRRYERAAKQEGREFSDWVRLVLDERATDAQREAPATPGKSWDQLTTDERHAIGLYRDVRDGDPDLNAALIELAALGLDRPEVRQAVLAILGLTKARSRGSQAKRSRG